MDKYVLTGNCVGCGECDWHCPNGAITESGDKYAITSDCTGCGECVHMCPVGAIIKKKRGFIHPGAA